MRKFTVNIIVFLSLALLSFPASAQRTMSGQPSLHVSVLYNGPSACAEAFFSQYTLGGYWQAGIEGKAYDVPISTGSRLDYIHTAVSSGYMYRVAGTRNRLLNYYMGGRVFMGVEIVDPWKTLPSYVSTGIKPVSFLYGISPRMELEVFFCRKCALLLTAGIPVNFSSNISWIHYEAGLGFKVEL